MLTDQPTATDAQTINQKTHWSWADLVSTYSFWGLLIFYIIAINTPSFLSTVLSSRISENISQYTIFSSISNVSLLLGFYPAWLAAKNHGKSVLFVAAAIQAIGVAVASIPVLYQVTILRILGAVLLGFGTGTIGILIPVIFAGGRGGAKTYAVSFGAMYVFSRICPIFYYLLIGKFFNDAIEPIFWVLPLIILGTLFLIPIKRGLFNEMPGRNLISRDPVYHNPVIYALLCLIPFFYIYWLNRLHGEVAYVAPSNKILSSRASIWMGILLPFAIPVMLVTLAEALNDQTQKQGELLYKGKVAVTIWSFLCFPVSMALIQSELNRVM